LIYDRFKPVGTVIFEAILLLLAVGYIAGIEIKKPNIIGKVAMIAVGILEMMGVFFLSGADIL